MSNVHFAEYTLEKVCPAKRRELHGKQVLKAKANLRSVQCHFHLKGEERKCLQFVFSSQNYRKVFTENILDSVVSRHQDMKRSILWRFSPYRTALSCFLAETQIPVSLGWRAEAHRAEPGQHMCMEKKKGLFVNQQKTTRFLPLTFCHHFLVRVMRDHLGQLEPLDPRWVLIGEVLQLQTN